MSVKLELLASLNEAAYFALLRFFMILCKNILQLLRVCEIVNYNLFVFKNRMYDKRKITMQNFNKLIRT